MSALGMSHTPFDTAGHWKSVFGFGHKAMSALGMSHAPFELQTIGNQFLDLVTKQ